MKPKIKEIVSHLAARGLIRHQENLPVETYADGSIAYIKVYRRGDCGVVPPNDAPFQFVVHLDMDGHGDWIPSHAETAASPSELRWKIEKIIAVTSGVTIEAADWFETMAFSIGLKLKQSTWSNL